MIRASIQIDSGDIQDSVEGYNLIYMESDSHMAAPNKPYDTTSYIEEAGEHIDPRTVEAAFDFTIKFVAEVRPEDGESSVNSIIKQLNDAMFTRSASGMLTAHRVTVYDHYKNRRITGYPQPISEPDGYYNVYGHQFAIIALELRVNDPPDCDFDYIGIGRMIIGSTFIVA